MKRQAVLVDLDGTLVDSNYHHALAWHEALLEHGHVVPVVAIHRRVGMGGGQMLEALIGRADEEVENGWRTRFEAMVPQIQAFDGAGALLRAFAANGLRVVLATSAPEDLLDALKAKLGADDVIDAVVTADDVDAAKPEPDVFAAALKKAGVEAPAAAVVGDSTWDIAAAAKAGLDCVALESGGYGRAELLDAGALAVYRDPEDLRERLAGSPLNGGA